MYAAVAALLDRLDGPDLAAHGVIPWACPVPFFGDLTRATVATVGINPSDKEFVGADGLEFDAADRRLPTLESLGISRWADADHRCLAEIVRACRGYFRHNPYDRWFRVLDRLLAGPSFYGDLPDASHVDLVPWATTHKWATLAPADRRALVGYGARGLGLMLRDSPVDTLLLNGRSVVTVLGTSTGVPLRETRRPAWDLRRPGGRTVAGVSYDGHVDAVGGVALGRPVRVLGWNHNLQSSFGVTGGAVEAISVWVTKERAAG